MDENKDISEQHSRVQEAYEIEKFRTKLVMQENISLGRSFLSFLGILLCTVLCALGLSIMLGSGLCAFAFLQRNREINLLIIVVVLSAIAFIPGFFIAGLSFTKLINIIRRLRNLK